MDVAHGIICVTVTWVTFQALERGVAAADRVALCSALVTAYASRERLMDFLVTIW